MSFVIRRSLFNWAAAAAIVGLCAVPAAQAAPGDPLTPAFDVRAELVERQSASAVARAADGSTVIVWQDGGANAIVGRRYAADGSPLDDGFVIATAVPTVDRLLAPDVAMDAAGNFVVVWLVGDTRESTVTDRRPSRVQGRRYTADGVPAGTLLTPDAANPAATHSVPAVAVAADGDFVLSFKHGFMRVGSDVLSVNGEELLAQRYDRDGLAQGALITAARIDANLDSNLGVPYVLLVGIDLQTFTGSPVDIAIADDGAFVLAWVDRATTDVTLYTIYKLFNLGQSRSTDVLRVRRYAANGTARGPAQRIATGRTFTSDSTLGNFENPIVSAPRVAMAANGAQYVVSWIESAFDGRHRRPVYAQTFGADGRALSVERLYGDSSENPRVSAVAMNASGEFILSWGGAAGIMARLAGADGGPLTGAITVAARTRTELLYDSDVAMDRDGNVAVTWTRATDFSSREANEIVRARLLMGPRP